MKLQLSKRAMFLALAVISIPDVAQPLAAAESVPFSAELTAVFVGRDREAFLFALEGSAMQMVEATALVRHEVRGQFEFGVFVLESANGDTLVSCYAFEHDKSFQSERIRSNSVPAALKMPRAAEFQRPTKRSYQSNPSACGSRLPFRFDVGINETYGRRAQIAKLTGYR